MKEKIFVACIIIISVLFYVVPELYSLIHAFDAPDFFWFRFSFVFSFVLCAVVARVSSYITKKNVKTCLVILAGVSVFYCIEQRIQGLENQEYNSNNIYNLLINLLFLMLWIGIMFLVFNYKRKVVVSILAIILVSIELGTNFAVNYFDRVDKTEYDNWNDAMEIGISTIQQAESDEFYRLIAINDIIHNSDSWYGYKGVSDFASSENYKLRKSLSNIGFGTTPRMTLATGYTPVSEMILNIKYLLACNFYENYETGKFMPNDLVTINKIDYTLGPGFAVNDSFVDFSFDSRNVFSNQNSLLKAMTDLDVDCYYKVERDRVHYKYDNSLVYTDNSLDLDGYFIERSSDVGKFEISVDKEENNFLPVYMQFEIFEPNMWQYDFVYDLGIENAANVTDLRISNSCAAKMLDKENEYYVLIYGEEPAPSLMYFDDILFYEFDISKLMLHYEELKKSQFIVEVCKNGYISGTIDVESDKKLLYTSIPYDDGWKVKINGEEGEIIPLLDGAFLGVQLPDEGKYSIELSYDVKGLKTGLFGSTIGVVITILVFIIERNRRKSMLRVF